MTTNHTYYLPAQRRVCGDHKDDIDLVIFLVATYFRLLPINSEAGKYDGVSVFTRNGVRIGYSVVLGETKMLEIVL